MNLVTRVAFIDMPLRFPVRTPQEVFHRALLFIHYSFQFSQLLLVVLFSSCMFSVFTKAVFCCRSNIFIRQSALVVSGQKPGVCIPSPSISRVIHLLCSFLVRFVANFAVCKKYFFFFLYLLINNKCLHLFINCDEKSYYLRELGCFYVKCLFYFNSFWSEPLKNNRKQIQKYLLVPYEHLSNFTES